MKIDTVLVYDPSALYERNPDHYITARAVESACRMAGSDWDYPEHFRAGLKPHAPARQILLRARTAARQSRCRHLPFIDKKVFANLANVTQGPAGNTGAALRRACTTNKLPLLGNDDETANRQYTKTFALGRDRSGARLMVSSTRNISTTSGPDDSDVESMSDVMPCRYSFGAQKRYFSPSCISRLFDHSRTDAAEIRRSQ